MTARQPSGGRALPSGIVAILVRFRTVLTTTGSVVGTTLVNSVLGFAYWWVAVRIFSPESTGLAVAAISAMALLGRVAVLGVETALVAVLPTYAGNRSGLVLAAFIVSALAAAVVGLAFAVVGPLLFPTFSTIVDGPGLTGLFTVGVVLTTTTFLFDVLLIGMLRGSLQLLRNIVFAVVKLLLLVVALEWFGDSEASIYATWTIGNLLSLVLVVMIVLRSHPTRQVAMPEWRSILGLGRNAMGHHVLNLARVAPALVVPILVAGLLSPEANAEFYVTLLLAGSLQVVAAAATFTLYAVASQSPEKLHHQVRFTIGLSVAGVTLGLLTLFALSGVLLSLFGWQDSLTNRVLILLLGLAAYPMIIKDHWLNLRRIQQDVRWAAWIASLGAVLEIVLAGIGAVLGGLVGAAAGWLVAVLIQAILMTRFVYGEAAAPPPLQAVGSRASG